jgi:Chromatin organization modifier domain 2
MVLWSTIEPKDWVESAYPQLVANFKKQKAQKMKTPLKSRKWTQQDEHIIAKKVKISSTVHSVQKITKEPKKKVILKGQQSIDKYLVKLLGDFDDSDEELANINRRIPKRRISSPFCIWIR